MRETVPGISRNQMRETPTSAHLISCCLTDGGPLSILRLFRNRQKARKQGLLGPSVSGFVHENQSFFYPIFVNIRSHDCNFTPG